jgi:hypothetical protein
MWTRIQAHHDAVDATTLQPDPTRSLGFANDVFYRHSGDFFDVTEGGNPLPAAPGWDYSSGLGTPDITRLTKDASGDGTTAPAATITPAGSDPPEIYNQPPGQPSCNTLFWDPNPDAPDGFTGEQDDQLDIVEGDMGLTPDGQKLRVVLTIRDLSKEIPTGSNYLDYETYWNWNGTTYGVSVQVDSSGNVSYADGTMSVTDAGGTTNYQFNPNPNSTATGSFGSGPNGQIEVDVPLGEIGSPAAGDKLTAPGAYTADGVNAAVTGFGFIADQDGPGRDYTVGEPTCIDPQTTTTAAHGRSGSAPGRQSPGAGHARNLQAREP